MFLSQYKTLIKNSMWFFLGNFISKSITFIMLPVFTRFMSPSEYGKLDVINTTISLLLPIVSLSIVDSVFRFSAESREESSNVISSAIVIAFSSFLISLSFYPVFSTIELFQRYGTYFYILFILTILNGILKQFVRGLGNIKLFVSSDIFYTTVFVLSNIVFLVKMKLGLIAYLMSNIVSLLLSSILIFFYGRVYHYLRPRFNLSVTKEMLRYSIPLIPNNFMWWIVNVSDRYLLSYFLGYNSTGIYSVSAKFPSLITILYGIFAQAWQISAIDEYKNGNYSKFFFEIFSVLSSLLFLFTSVFMLFLKSFISIFVSESFFSSWRYIPFLLLGSIFYCFSSFYGTNYITTKKTKGAFVTTTVAAIVNFIVNIVLIPVIGIQAASLSTFLAYLILWIVRVFHTKNLTKNLRVLKSVSLLLALTLLQSFVLFFFNGFVSYILQLVILLAIVLTIRREISKIFKVLVALRK